jgi:hypothetical protein
VRARGVVGVPRATRPTANPKSTELAGGNAMQLTEMLRDLGRNLVDLTRRTSCANLANLS